MIEWIIISLFAISSILLIASLYKTRQTAKAEEQRIDMAHISLLKEVNELKEAVQQLKLERDILLTESDIAISPEELTQKRVILDLYMRGYSVENIGTQMGLPTKKIQEILAPYAKRKFGRSESSNEN